jgi:DNA (cytosine-5)-methyltransferase 1
MNRRSHRSAVIETPVAVGLFSGCGGLDYGALKAGFQFAGAYDSDEIAIETYRRNVQPEACAVDLSVEAPKLPKRIDLVLGGPPCQGFSSAGPKNNKDPRNRFWQVYLEVLAKTRPRVFLLENVYGFQRELPKFLAALRRETAGAYLVEYRKINSQFYGVPQHRLRLFVIGVAADEGECVPWPKPCLDEYWGYRRFESGLVTVQQSLQDLGPAKACHSPREQCWGTPHEHLELEASHVAAARHIPNGGSLRSIPDQYMPKPFFGRTRPRVGGWPWYYRKPVVHLPGRTVTASTRPIYSQVLAPDVYSVDTPTGWRWDAVDESAHTSEDGLYTSPVTPRRLTIRECARLQTFPDSFEFFGSLFDKHRQIGNAVPVTLAEHLCRAIFEWLTDEKARRFALSTHNGAGDYAPRGGT